MSWGFNPFTGNIDRVGGESTQVNQSAKLLTDTRILGENISALRIVRALDNNVVLIANPDTYINGKALGVALQSGVLNDTVEILIFGKLEDNSFNFPLNEPLFLGLNGEITSTPPTMGFSVRVGHSLGLGAIFINIQEPIEL